ncbi:hypothetical protein GCM10028796_55470 [Ramlibacter monticola]|uniref:DUF3421 domain-containing protein n=1 Tax=Ramlibacter monticola TaxID=1926872 RepID=A0A936Z6E3_9BURK|nr:DM9 repeat-containing protein [Ramlibacter monticola]MBL0394932.1 DUF3421 domain-containing protein [Ramlibacter monticola]
MQSMGHALAAVLVMLAPALAGAEGLDWVAKDGRGTLVVAGGSDALPLHVCRVDLGSGVVVPGKFWTGGDRGGECRVAAGGKEQGYANFEMLVEAADTEAVYRWVPGHAMGYPQNSVIGGGAADGQRLLVCAAVDKSDGSVHPGYMQDDNCIYGRDGAQAVAENYLVLATNDPEVTRTEEAQPALQGFDPGSILGGKGVAAFCARKADACVATLPANF